MNNLKNASNFLKEIPKFFYSRKTGIHVVPVKNLVIFSFLGFVYLKFHHIPVSRRRFMKKVKERDDSIQLSFENFTKSLILSESLKLINIKTEEIISERTFGNEEFLLIYRGKFIDFLNLHKEFITLIKPKHNCSFLYILEDNKSKDIINNILKLDLQGAIICTAEDPDEEFEGFQANTLLLMVNERKELVYSKEVADGDYRNSLKNALIKMNKEKEKEYLKSLEFKL